MKHRHMSVLLLGIILLYAALGAAQVRTMYVKVAEENLRIAPNGRKIGTILKGTEMTILQERDNWVQVQLTGWFWKPSLTAFKASDDSGEFHALHIMVKTREKAQEIKQKLEQGQDFSTLARQHSIAPSASIGGDLGYFDRGDFSQKIESVIVSLDVNKVSDIVETAHGYNIFKRIE
ncbi:MAG: peptidylprolyl isomerase [candidate division KSB1 bacterium]|nr:peptidylprolyl isomerase [candidate division KSB1 bacterium]